MQRRIASGLSVAVIFALLAACASAPQFPGANPQHVQLACAGLNGVPGVPQLWRTVRTLPAGITLEIMHANGEPPAYLSLPANAASGDRLAYTWHDRGAPLSQNTWACTVEWRYDGQWWRLQRLGAKWGG